MWRTGQTARPRRQYKIPARISSYIEIVVTVWENELDSVCLNGWAGQGKPSRRQSKIPVRVFKDPYIQMQLPYSRLLILNGLSKHVNVKCMIRMNDLESRPINMKWVVQYWMCLFRGPLVVVSSILSIRAIQGNGIVNLDMIL